MKVEEEARGRLGSQQPQVLFGFIVSLRLPFVPGLSRHYVILMPLTLSPSPSPSTTSPDLPATLHDPKSLFYQQVSLRRAIIASYWTIILLAVPLWWYTTRIERLALPSGRVQQFAQHSLELPIPICIEGPRIPFIDKIQVQLLEQISQDPQRWKALAPRLFGSTDCGKLICQE